MPKKHEKNVQREWLSRVGSKLSQLGFGAGLRRHAPSSSDAPEDSAEITHNPSVPSRSMTTKKQATKKKVTTKTKKATTKRVAKKAVKKTTKKATKRTTKKAAKRTTKKATGKALVCAPDEQCFWVHEGPILRDLQELERALNEMSEMIFEHHVTKEKNDFADWVEYVLRDKAAATALRKARKPHTARKVVIKQLKLYRLPE